MEAFDPLVLVAPIVNLLTQTGNFVLNIISLVLRVLGVRVLFL